MTIDIYWSIDIYWLLLTPPQLQKLRARSTYKVGLTVWPCLSNFTHFPTWTLWISSKKARRSSFRTRWDNCFCNSLPAILCECGNRKMWLQSVSIVDCPANFQNIWLNYSTELAFWWSLSNTWLIQKSSACSLVLLQPLCQRPSGLNVLLHIARPMNTCKEKCGKPYITMI